MLEAGSRRSKGRLGPAEDMTSAKALRQPVLGGGKLCGWSRVNKERGAVAKVREEGAHGGMWMYSRCGWSHRGVGVR